MNTSKILRIIWALKPIILTIFVLAVMVGALIWALNQKPKMSENNYSASTNKTSPEHIVVPSGELEAFYSKVQGKKFSVIKLDGTIDDRQDDLQELAKDWIFYRDRINAVSLTNCFIGEVKFFLFYLVITFIFSSRANSLNGLYKNFLKL